MFQQHQDESLCDAWTRFKDLIRKVPHHGLSLWSQIQIFFDHIDRYTQIDINHAEGGNLKGLSAEEDHLVGNEVVRVKIPKCMSWLDAYDKTIGDLDIMEDKVDNPNPKSAPQVLLSFEEYTPTVTYSEEVEETLRTPIEVEPLDKTQLEDLGLNTCNHDLPLSFREVLSFDEMKPQPQPLPNCPPLDISLGDKRGL
ncbi:hypothetical protein Tco_0651917 [Tanacetum coccineum]|uniref:Retrotransposon gag domain-containing protein n=1 Tax=Tanacetum coccineum TaxID=301880 RepID=A0ABQ4WW42_9ASTR